MTEHDPHLMVGRSSTLEHLITKFLSYTFSELNCTDIIVFTININA